jgi:hypothetical protein
MFRQITAIILLTAFLAQTFTGSLIRLDYYLNTSAYAKDCINKARPKMHCNGNCQVMKKIREEEKKEQEHTERKFENKETVLFSKSFYATIIGRSSIIISTAYYIKDDVRQLQMPRSCFHPPAWLDLSPLQLSCSSTLFANTIIAA